MLSELSYKAPAMELGPIDVSNPPYERNPDYWNARDSVQIPVKQYFEWVNVDIWTCDLTIANTITEANYDDTETTSTITFYEKVFETNVGRQNKAPGYTYSGDIVTPPYISGQIYEDTDPTFPDVYQSEGPQPESWWMKQRSNVLKGNHERAYFNVTAHWANLQNPVGEGYIDFDQYFSLGFGIQIFGSETAYYDPETKTVWPGLNFESFSTDSRHNYTVGWQGTTLGADPYSTVSLTVDGVTIPAEVYWPNYAGSSGLSISIDWTPGSTRDL